MSLLVDIRVLRFMTSVNDTSHKFIAGALDTGHKFITGVLDTSNKFITSVKDTGDKTKRDFFPLIMTRAIN